MIGILHAGLAPVIVVADVKPNLVLVAVVVVTAVFGFQAGILWAFVAGSVANLLVPEPLGTIPLSLLVVAALVAATGRLIGRLVWIYPVLAAFAGSLLADAIRLSLASLVADYDAGLPLSLLLPAATLNAALVALVLVPVRLLAARVAVEERPAW